MSEPSHERRAVQAVGTICAATALPVPTALVVYLVGSLALTGGQVAPGGHPIWDSVVDYPLFSIPAPVLIVLAALNAAATVGLVAIATVDDAPRLVGSLGPIAAAAVGSLGFAGLTPDPAGATFGTQWWAAVGFGIALVALSLGVAKLGPRYERRRRAAAKASVTGTPSQPPRADPDRE